MTLLLITIVLNLNSTPIELIYLSDHVFYVKLNNIPDLPMPESPIIIDFIKWSYSIFIAIIKIIMKDLFR